jgi:acyl-CoA synthetase (AMP-forming)/AMP-acid ligase II
MFQVEAWRHQFRRLALEELTGFYHIVDRKSDVIISGGMNVYPREIESVAMLHEGVWEAAAVGVPDEEWGEAIHLFYVGNADDSVEEALQTLFDERLASYKRPKQFHRIGELPRNAGGKLLRRVLKQQALPA